MYTLCLLGLAAVQGAHAWGNLGHETVAYIAQAFVNSDTESWAQDILSDTSDSYLASIATWADTFRYESDGKWSEPFHFIDANDSPPSSCNVDYDRDCGSTGCSVSAMVNYTQRVQSSELTDADRDYALRFIVHFTGDLTQPLHDEAYEYGANDVDVTYNGDSDNLHHTWDTSMIDTLLGTTGSSLTTAKSWANTLIKQIQSGSYSSQKASWIEGLDVTDPKTTAMSWATDANSFVCSTVMPNGVSTLEKNDLYPDYYNSVIDTIELQIAKAGYRLAAYLDGIVANENNDKKRSSVHGVKRSIDLTGQDLLIKEMTPQQKARLARGLIGCNHQH